MGKNNKKKNKVGKESLHLCTFKTPTSWAVMTEQGDADCAFEMRNGVKKNFILIEVLQFVSISFYFVSVFLIVKVQSCF